MIVWLLDLYSIQHYVIKFVCDLRHLCCSPGTLVSSTNKTDRHDITEILLKVALNSTNQTTRKHYTTTFHLVNYLVTEIPRYIF